MTNTGRRRGPPPATDLGRALRAAGHTPDSLADALGVSRDVVVRGMRGDDTLSGRLLRFGLRSWLALDEDRRHAALDDRGSA